MGRRPFGRLEALARGRGGLAVVAGWGFAEAVALPVVPDVVIGLLALVVPRRAGPMFVSLVGGALAGTAVLYIASLAAPGRVEAMLLALPAIDQPMLDDASASVVGGDPVAIAVHPPGTPLKVFTWAWATGPATPLALVAGAVLNRLVRVGIPLLALTALGTVAPAWLRRHDRLVLTGYAGFYVVAYAIYWR